MKSNILKLFFIILILGRVHTTYPMENKPSVLLSTGICTALLVASLYLPTALHEAGHAVTAKLLNGAEIDFHLYKSVNDAYDGKPPLFKIGGCTVHSLKFWKGGWANCGPIIGLKGACICFMGPLAGLICSNELFLMNMEMTKREVIPLYLGCMMSLRCCINVAQHLGNNMIFPHDDNDAYNIAKALNIHNHPTYKKFITLSSYTSFTIPASLVFGAVQLYYYAKLRTIFLGAASNLVTKLLMR